MVTYIEVDVLGESSTITINANDIISVKKVEAGASAGNAKIELVNNNRLYLNNVYYTSTEDYDTFATRLATATGITVNTP